EVLAIARVGDDVPAGPIDVEKSGSRSHRRGASPLRTQDDVIEGGGEFVGLPYADGACLVGGVTVQIDPEVNGNQAGHDWVARDTRVRLGGVDPRSQNGIETQRFRTGLAQAVFQVCCGFDLGAAFANTAVVEEFLPHRVREFSGCLQAAISWLSLTRRSSSTRPVVTSGSGPSAASFFASPMLRLDSTAKPVT